MIVDTLRPSTFILFHIWRLWICQAKPCEHTASISFSDVCQVSTKTNGTVDHVRRDSLKKLNSNWMIRTTMTSNASLLFSFLTWMGPNCTLFLFDCDHIFISMGWIVYIIFWIRRNFKFVQNTPLSNASKFVRVVSKNGLAIFLSSNFKLINWLIILNHVIFFIIFLQKLVHASTKKNALGNCLTIFLRWLCNTNPLIKAYK